MNFTIDYTKKPECNKKITLSQYSDSLDPFRLKCNKEKGHEGEHEGLIWSVSEGAEQTYRITWKSKFI